jgi:hypothetical protein
MATPYTVKIDENKWQKIVLDAEENLVGKLKNKIKIDSTIIGNKKEKTPSEIPSSPGIYAIWSNNTVKYIGEAAILKSRLRQHLIYKSSKTGSKLEKVKDENTKGNTIFISFICVEPPSLRLAIEDRLIGKRREKNHSALPWNIKSTAVKDCTNWVLEQLKNAGEDGINTPYLSYAYALEKDVSVSLDKILKALVKNGDIEHISQPGCEGYRIIKKTRGRKKKK